MTVMLGCFQGVFIVRPIGLFRRHAEGFHDRRDARRCLELLKPGGLNLVALT